LGQTRNADEQAVALGEEGDEELFEDILLADDDLGALGEDALGALAEPVRGGQVVGLEDCGVGEFRGGHAQEVSGLLEVRRSGLGVTNCIACKHGDTPATNTAKQIATNTAKHSAMKTAKQVAIQFTSHY